MEAFVERLGGDFCIKHILITTNGLSALKAILSIRQWTQKTFESVSSIKLTLLVSSDDLNSNLEALRLVPSIVPVPGGPSLCNYGNIELVADLAERENVDAVYVGWGHASENPLLVERISNLPEQNGKRVRLIGPSSDAMRAVGDKIGSTIIAQSLGIPTVPWSGSGVLIDTTAFSPIKDSVYSKCHVPSLNAGIELSGKIGFPLMIKASNGGGGKGIRIVHNVEDFAMAYNQVVVEVPDSPIFLMKVVNNARHIEVQLIGDMHGNITSLYGRDCSIQRRHQKVIEEAPATYTVPPSVFFEMEKDAIKLGRFVGYRGAGTVEYLYNPADQTYFFLEMNPRLQVEHPATELITGINIVAVMLQVMMGIPLFNIPEIREFFDDGKNGGFDLIHRKAPNGHVIATRLTSEDVHRGFQPGQGRLYDFFIPSHPLDQIFSYVSLYPQNSSLHNYSDSQFGHIFSHSKKGRNDARLNLIGTLIGTRITSEFNTNLESLISILYKEEYIKNDTKVIDTQWLDRIIASNSKTLWARKHDYDSIHKAILGAIYISHFKYFIPAAKIFREKSQIGLVPMESETKSALMNQLKFQIMDMEVKCQVSLFDKSTYRLFFLSDQGKSPNEILIKFKELPNDSLLVHLSNNEKYIISSQPQKSCDTMRILIDNDGEFEVKLRSEDPRDIISPSSGRIVRYLVSSGEVVKPKTPIVEIEVMKMVISLSCKIGGIVSIRKSVNSLVQASDLLASIEPTGDTQYSLISVQPKNILQTLDSPFLKDPKNDYIIPAREDDRYIFFCEKLRDMLDGFDCCSWSDVVLYNILGPKTQYKTLDFIKELLSEYVEHECLNRELNGSGLDSRLFELCGKLGNDADAIMRFCRRQAATKNRDSVMENLITRITNIDQITDHSIKNVFLRMLERLSVSRSTLIIEKFLFTENSVADHSKSEKTVFQELLAIKSNDAFLAAIHNFLDSKPRLFMKVLNLPLTLVSGVTERAILVRAFEAYFQRLLGPLTFTETQDGGLLFRHPLNSSQTKLYKLSFDEDDVNKEGACLVYIYGRQGKKKSSYNFPHVFVSIRDDHVYFEGSPLELDPIVFDLMELARWEQNYTLSLEDNSVILARCKCNSETRLLIPVLIFNLKEIRGKEDIQEMLESQAGKILTPIIHYLQGKVRQAKGHYLLINCLPVFSASPFDLLSFLEGFIKLYAERLWKAGISFAEIIFPNGETKHEVYRVYLKHGIGRVFEMKCYLEALNERGEKEIRLVFSNDPLQSYLKTIPENIGPIPSTDGLTAKRMQAALSDTCFVYDIPALIEACSKYMICMSGSRIDESRPILMAREIILRKKSSGDERINDYLSFTHRSEGQNDIGVVAWLINLRTVENPSEYRPIIVFSNDITHKHGSFGRDECELVYQVSKYARETGIPRIFMSANSGARIGVDEQVKKMFRVKWKDAKQVDGLGREIDYLYLTEGDYECVKEHVIGTHVPNVGYRIESILGGNAVEQLQGSSKMAGETSYCYQEGIFTLSIAMGRSVGIGAYLLRLGHRVIQRTTQPILLTGYQALNRVLGNANVYSSNLQMGGFHVLGKNGVSHVSAENEWFAVIEALKWLSFVPRTPTEPPVIYLGPYLDTWDRDVETQFNSNWTNSSVDVRPILTGYVEGKEETFLRGLFDRESFVECMQGWADNVIVGRGRIGGYPLGLISTQMSSFTLEEPSDPARTKENGNIKEMNTRPGGVWYTDSSEKTHSALQDMLLEGLDVLIIAHFRGFSGGVTDMFQGILKQGSGIVETLVAQGRMKPGRSDRKQKVIVYVPPYAELRGGAWVVIDRNILYTPKGNNCDGYGDGYGDGDGVTVKQPSSEEEAAINMEIWVDETSSAGVLETVGVMGLKYREKDIVATISRLEGDMKGPIDDGSVIMSEYRRVAENFIQLHDNPLRMKALGVVDGITSWKNLRRVLFHRFQK